MLTDEVAQILREIKEIKAELQRLRQQSTGLLTIEDVAARFDVHPQTVREYYRRPVNALKRFKVGRVVRFREIDVLKFQERNTR